MRHGLNVSIRVLGTITLVLVSGAFLSFILFTATSEGAEDTDDAVDETGQDIESRIGDLRDAVLDSLLSAEEDGGMPDVGVNGNGATTNGNGDPGSDTPDDTAEPDVSDIETDTDPTDDGLVAHVGFEDEDLGAFAFDGALLGGLWTDTGADVPPHDDAVVIVDSPTRGGDQAVEINLEEDWDFSDVDSVRTNPIVEHSQREQLWGDGYSTWDEPFWTGFSIYVPDDFEPDSVTEQILEFWPQKPFAQDWSAGHGKPLDVQVDGEEFVIISDYIADGSQQRDRETVALQSGEWHDFVMYIDWSHENDGDDGFMYIWINGDSVYEHEGNTAADSDPGPPYPPKFGIYKFPWDQGDVGDSTHRSYVFDQFRFADSDGEYGTVMPR